MVDIQEIVKIVGEVIKNLQDVIYRENFKTNPFRKGTEKLFASRQIYKDEGSVLMQGLFKLKMNSLYGIQIRKVFNDFAFCKSEHWMQTEYDDNVIDYWKLPNGNYILKMKQDDKLDGDNDLKKHCLHI